MAKADLPGVKRCPLSRHCADVFRCPLLTQSGHAGRSRSPKSIFRGKASLALVEWSGSPTLHDRNHGKKISLDLGRKPSSS